MKLDINMLKESVEELKTYSDMLPDLEKEGKFTVDQDAVSPFPYEPITEDFPFIRKGPIWAIKSAIYNFVLNQYTKKINKELTNLKIVGKENLKGVKGAIVTCNHISKVDSFAVRAAINENIMFVASEINNWKGPMGQISRNTGYIPLPTSLNIKLMRKFNNTIKYYLKKNKKILIYPEQAMWREFTRPRPIQNGAFHYAASNFKPIIPLFITIEPKAQLVDEQGRANFGDYTIHILPPIYPKQELPVKENAQYMKLENFRLWKECYEQTYGKPLTYSTDAKVWVDKYSEYGSLVQLTSAVKDKAPLKKTADKAVKSTSDKNKKQNKTASTKVKSKQTKK